MPELPEVETIVVGLRPLLQGQVIGGVSHCDWPPTLAGYDPQAFCAPSTTSTPKTTSSCCRATTRC